MSETLPVPSRPAAPPAVPPLERRARVDLGAVRHNVRALRARLTRADGTAPRLMAVVKADAYGHGAVPVARAVLEAGADRLGVAHVAEALELRAAGIAAPVLAWLHTRDTPFAAALEADVALGVSSAAELEAVAAAARAVGRRAVVHVKTDTGLGRNGCLPEALPALAARAAALQAEGLVDVEGVFSHLAVADEPERAQETDAQAGAFAAAAGVLAAAGVPARVRHLANTPAALTRPDLHHDMVRVGLGLYGLSPFAGRSPEEFGLRPAMSLQTTLAQVKRVGPGQGVSYGFRFRTTGDTVLGLVPLGYADGVPRVAEHAPVAVGGRHVRAVGRIAMDQFLVDLGPDAREEVGDPVELFGPDSGIPADAWAEAAGTINYELVTRISPRVPRVHVDAAAPGDTGEGRA
ncbi:alanine racemase [Micrococcus flavus]|uniref:Alanine racemase n=1 Tax=Micrococcus flavus TaxID=384602 RepID=A0A7W7L319_9MICC|nr:alanine racemase [Micrococcus flavus]MBB4882191.1 alanine racemase [Micrococcus flavus]GGK50953.1 alanine racemase [Micrococcus flavus]